MKRFYLVLFFPWFCVFVLFQSIATARPKKCPSTNRANKAVQTLFGECPSCESKLAQMKKDIRWLNGRLRKVEKQGLETIKYRLETIERIVFPPKTQTRLVQSSKQNGWGFPIALANATGPSQQDANDTKKPFVINITYCDIWTTLVLLLLCWVFWRGIVIDVKKSQIQELQAEIKQKSFDHALERNGLEHKIEMLNLEMAHLRDKHKIEQSAKTTTNQFPNKNEYLVRERLWKIVEILNQESASDSTTPTSPDENPTTTPSEPSKSTVAPTPPEKEVPNQSAEEVVSSKKEDGDDNKS